MQGRFITFEGGEGAGKSTQIAQLTQSLQAHGVKVLCTREPGGCPISERIREILVTGQGDDLDGTSELLLILAARHEHIRQVIRPALASGHWVLCDRFEDSTLAYQGGGRGGDGPWLRQLGQWIRGDVFPDLTLLLDLDPTVGLARSKRRGGQEQRFEQEALSFHQQVRQAFLQMAQQEPQRMIPIDADQPVQMVAATIWREVEGRFFVSF
ncbi:thymidylate kinase [Magnetococcus marinus MC-1]|uniref:Thymidylate kinase n=1 Tax=Magnetococcus marinus (strain ATCC BAA-1437 / JCM 17883 / MC-1) TaxID=156889 RepID=KTHY_MAGMM|nr:dTMP kinase [Magnetococcus marinus]A0L8T5.1 RecName: Full=Thymidylate kinase; AltName: Full=dTMP kinase [Magnetococcus marinus MC-1]ABK44378.1 thymidylate kinase [Magnetococcus marinus MC-1]